MGMPIIVYICSGSRCGSTITDMFLGGHSRVASLGEVNFLGKAISMGELCSCGASVSECSAWQQIYTAIKLETGIDIPSKPYTYKLWDARSRVIIDHEYQNKWFYARFYYRRAWLGIREYAPVGLRNVIPIPPAYSKAVDNKMRLFGVISRLWDKDVVVDSSKNPWEAVELARRYPEQVRVILVTRDGRGVYLSRRSSGFDQESSVREWLKYYRNAAPMLKKRLPADNLMQMTYEAFAADPENNGKKLCTFVGIDYEPAMMDLGGGERHMANGNDTRFSPQKGIKLDERWRRELDGEEMAFFERYGGDVNRMLGYV